MAEIVKEERNEQGQLIYREWFNGYWEKFKYDNKGNETYFECSDGSWIKTEYDVNSKKTHYESSDGFWEKYKYDSNGNRIYYENSAGCWIKMEYDENGKVIYQENSKAGIVYDYRDKDDIRVENVRNFMEQIEGLTQKGNYSEFEVALLICERSDIHSSEINRELVDKVMDISQSCDTLFSDYINEELRDIFENHMQKEDELDLEM